MTACAPASSRATALLSCPGMVFHVLPDASEPLQGFPNSVTVGTARRQ